MKNLLITITCLVTILFSTDLFAQDAGLSVQGVLRTIENTALENGTYSLTFRLYNAPSGGTALWEETQENVELRGGVYSVTLGDVNPLNIPFDEKYFLGINVEGAGELTPRAELTSSPYALSLIGEDNVFPNSGNVGVGDPNPAQKLTVKNGTGRIGLDAETNADYTTTIIGKDYEVTFDNNGDSKDFSFRQNGNERVRVRHHGLNMKGDGSAYFDIQAANSRALIGFTAANSSIMNIHNIDGETRYTADLNRFYGRLYSYNGLNVLNERSFFYEKVDININGRSLATVGTDHSYLAFYPKTTAGGELGKIGYLSANTNDLSITNSETNGNITLEASNGGKVVVNDRLDVKQHLQVEGEANYQMSDYDYIDHLGIHENTGTATDLPFVIWAKGNIRAVELYADSDQRIKKELEISNSKNDLETLNKIEVTNYRHIDEVSKGAAIKKGLIAQQVASVFPEAISKTKDFIPDVFEFPKNVALENQSITFSLSKIHDLKEGDKIKIVMDTESEIFTISKINDPKSFSIDNWTYEIKDKKYFIYGKEVEDFHTVDYDRVFTLAVSAVQELSAQVDILKKENADTKKANLTLKAEIQGLSARMKNIETIFNATGSN